MYHNLKKISAIAITITAIVTVSSCGFDSDQPSEVATTNSPEESVVSDDPSVETPEPPTQEEALAECGEQITTSISRTIIGVMPTMILEEKMLPTLPRWERLSMAQRCEYAQRICDRLDSRSQQQQQIELMACELGGNCSGFPTPRQGGEATAIILSSQQIVCREKYEQFKQETLEESVQKNKQMIKEEQQQILDIMKESRKWN
ncbi:hypothetical protein [Planktothricoides raciborskii]|uniref:Uncharacterized protein n=1 Tax=Planktothricoides raciborskii FACHB-1370 TaxID=2949576 RepID=A0ABR8EN18_9CYAN|nr:hypothetical protein [Planktothricoides raciborskii]MBD2547910.1 hypothetical protein [Planktothricoides raciborskii FACHB-1370]MBD2586216.1 hypothetical protein [Planktothricoides raciborskii FACHB-1261]